MTASLRSCLALLLAASLPACGGKTAITQYEGCKAGDACSQGTTCVTTEFPATTGSQMICTSTCQLKSDCALDSQGNEVDCVILNANSAGQCFVDCSAAFGACAAEGTTCQTLGGFQICVP